MSYKSRGKNKPQSAAMGPRTILGSLCPVCIMTKKIDEERWVEIWHYHCSCNICSSQAVEGYEMYIGDITEIIPTVGG